MSRFTDLLHEAEVDDPVEEAAVLGARVTKVHQGRACTQSKTMTSHNKGEECEGRSGSTMKKSGRDEPEVQYDEEEWEGRSGSAMEKSRREEPEVRWRRVRRKNRKYNGEE